MDLRRSHPRPAVRHARDPRGDLVAGTTLRYVDPGMQLAVGRRQLHTIRATDTRFASDIRFTGSGTVRGTPFTLSGGLLSPNATVTGGRNQLQPSCRCRTTVIDVSGTLTGRRRSRARPLDHGLGRGRNIADMFAIIGVAIPDTRTYRVTSQLTKTDGEWRFTHLRGRFGDSDLAGRMTVAVSSRA